MADLTDYTGLGLNINGGILGMAPNSSKLGLNFIPNNSQINGYSLGNTNGPYTGQSFLPFDLPNQAKTGLAGLFGNGSGFLGSNVETKDLGLGIAGLQTLGNLFSGFKALGLANKQFDFSKMIAEKNLANSTSSYNTALGDRINSRPDSEMSPAEKQAYLSKNMLK